MQSKTGLIKLLLRSNNLPACNAGKSIFIDKYGSKAYAPSICRRCGDIAGCIPDGNHEYCEVCGSYSVVSGLVLLGAV